MARGIGASSQESGLFVIEGDLSGYLDESSHYTSDYCGWIKKVWKRCRYLYSDAFCTATVDMNCLQLAALYTLQDGLARDTEQILPRRYRYDQASGCSLPAGRLLGAIHIFHVQRRPGIPELRREYSGAVRRSRCRRCNEIVIGPNPRIFPSARFKPADHSDI
jgi:hypothetical protein